jgi:hypothetical protein
MEKIKMYINTDIAKMCGCSFSTVVKYAQKPENNINFAGKGNRKIFIWFEDDIERFKNRDVAPVGRPKKAAAPDKGKK